MKQVLPPRSAFINFPLGRECGKPHDVEMQTRILKETLELFTTQKEPGLIKDLHYQWHESFDWPGYLKDIQEMVEEEGSEMQEWKPKNNQ